MYKMYENKIKEIKIKNFSYHFLNDPNNLVFKNMIIDEKSYEDIFIIDLRHKI